MSSSAKSCSTTLLYLSLLFLFFANSDSATWYDIYLGVEFMRELLILCHLYYFFTGLGMPDPASRRNMTSRRITQTGNLSLKILREPISSFIGVSFVTRRQSVVEYLRDVSVIICVSIFLSLFFFHFTNPMRTLHDTIP
jgi:hypothetical protein